MRDFEVIYADPPWHYDFSKSNSREIENHYPTMTHEEICGLDVPSARNAVLFLLVGVKGNWSPPPQPLRVSSVYREARGRHSKKPDAIRNMIATWWPDARRLEMFCRYPSPGWHVWGNQVDSTVAALPFERFDPRADPAQDTLFGGVA